MLAEHLGSDTFLTVDAGALGMMTLRATGDLRLGHGDRVQFGAQAGKTHRFDADGKAMK